MSVSSEIGDINKEFHAILCEQDENRKKFFTRCGYPSERWIGKAFNSVLTIEECEFLETEYVKKFEDDFALLVDPKEHNVLAYAAQRFGAAGQVDQ